MTGRFCTSPMLNDALVGDHGVHLTSQSRALGTLQPFQTRTLPKWPKVTGTRGSWDLAISLKMISKARRLLSFAFYKVKMSVLERRLSGQKALPRLMTPVWAPGLTWEREQREPTPACYSVTSTHAHTTQDQCCSARISYEVAGSCWSSARACPTAVCRDWLSPATGLSVTSSTNTG